MFKNALVYRIDQWQPPTQTDIEQRLQGARFAPCGASQPASAGWVAPRGAKHGALLESVGGQLVLTLCSEVKSVPAGVVKVEGDFAAGDPVDLCDLSGTRVARGLVNYDAAEIPELLGRSTRELARALGPEYQRELIHRDDIVILDPHDE